MYIRLLCLITVMAVGPFFLNRPPTIFPTSPESSTALPTPADVALKFHTFIKNAQKGTLVVSSDQKVSFVQHEGTTASEQGSVLSFCPIDVVRADPKTISVQVRIKAFMTPRSFSVNMWNQSQTEPVSLLDFERAVDDGMPKMTERQWYPSLADYRSTTYLSQEKDKNGVGALRLSSALLSGIPAKTCATGEFFYTWLGEGCSQVDAFHTMISTSKMIGVCTYDGVPAYHLSRVSYEQTAPALDKKTKTFLEQGSRCEEYWVDFSGRFIGWQSVFQYAVVKDHHSIQLVERTYHYVQE